MPASATDVDGDGDVDPRDLNLFIRDWHLRSATSSADTYTDGYVNYLDLWSFSHLWKTDQSIALAPSDATMVASDNQSLDRPSGPWRRFLALSNDSPAKTVTMTLAVAFLGSVLVAGSAVLLRPLQIANKEAERRARVAEIVEQIGTGETLRIEARVVDLESGDYVDEMDPLRFDQRRAARDPALSLDFGLSSYWHTNPKRLEGLSSCRLLPTIASNHPAFLFLPSLA